MTIPVTRIGWLRSPLVQYSIRQARTLAGVSLTGCAAMSVPARWAIAARGITANVAANRMVKVLRNRCIEPLPAMFANDSMFAEPWKTGPSGARPSDLETGTGVIARAGDPRHKSQQR
jgi:hypothetical protein